MFVFVCLCMSLYVVVLCFYIGKRDFLCGLAWCRLTDRRGIHLPAIPSTPISAAVREESMAQIDSLPLATRPPPPSGTVNQFPQQKLINNCSLGETVGGWECVVGTEGEKAA